jgi:CheY-like chemotaxis protein
MNSILIIEDDAVLREMYTTKFEKENFSVNTAVDGQEGIEKMRSLNPQIVLLDLIMSKVSGFDVLKMVKDDPALNKIPILVLTNIFADVEDLLKNWGVTDFILKANTTPDEVVKKVKRVLENKPR